MNNNISNKKPETNIDLNKLLDDATKYQMDQMRSLIDPDIMYQKDMENACEDARRKKEEETDLLKSIAENVSAIKADTSGLILSIDDLINAVTIWSKIEEGNLLLIEQLLENMKQSKQINVKDEVIKNTIALATQKGLPTAFIFLLKFILAMSTGITI